MISFNPHTHEGCDKFLLCVLQLLYSFNPHTHEGCDMRADAQTLLEIKVSIHTPTKGVTPTFLL